MAELAEGPHETRVERFVLEAGDGTAVDAIHARPVGPPEAGLVVHPDMLGVRPLFDDLCRRLATNGYAVACTEPFARFPRDVRDAPDASVRMSHMKDMDDDRQLGDLAQAAGFLLDADGVERVSILGFCMGGMYTLEAAGQVCPTLAIFGDKDPWTPADDIDALRAAWRDRDDCEVVVYHDADHGFVHAPERPAHRPDDAADAWRRALEFLRRS